MAESAPQLPEDDIEAAVQQIVQNENAPADGDKRSTSDTDEGQTYEQRLFEFKNLNENEVFSDSFFDFRDLSLINIVHLMNELAKCNQALKKDKAAPQDIERVGALLHRYSKCVYFAMVVVFLLIYLHISYRCSGPRILVQTQRVWGCFGGDVS